VAYTEYDFYYAGTVSTADNFWALENPTLWKENLLAINASSVDTISGDYLANPTAYAYRTTLSWGAAGIEGKISAAGKTALENMYQSYWYIALSFDSGTTWNYYKVEKSDFSMQMQKYLFDTLPNGSLSLTIRTIPGFLITDYIIATV
jgi:hypothetical protein